MERISDAIDDENVEIDDGALEQAIAHMFGDSICLCERFAHVLSSVILRKQRRKIICNVAVCASLFLLVASSFFINVFIVLLVAIPLAFLFEYCDTHRNDFAQESSLRLKFLRLALFMLTFVMQQHTVERRRHVLKMCFLELNDYKREFQTMIGLEMSIEIRR